MEAHLPVGQATLSWKVPPAALPRAHPLGQTKVGVSTMKELLCCLELLCHLPGRLGGRPEKTWVSLGQAVTPNHGPGPMKTSSQARDF